MESGSIQLPFGFVRGQKTNDDLQFNLPLNYRKDLLFDKLLYVAQLNNPAIENVVNRNNADDLAVQKYLLATDLLQDTIQENLNMIVTDGGFNNASICRVLDMKYPSVMKKPNPIDFMFKDKAKFDVQNPIIGSLYEQIVDNEKKEKEILRALDNAPAPKDILLQERLDKLTDFNRKRGFRSNNNDDDDDDNNNNNNNNSGNVFPPTPKFRGIPPTPPITTKTPSTSLTAAQKFLLWPDGNEKIAEAIAEDSSRPTIKKITFSDRITKIFPSLTAEADVIEEESASSFIDDFSETDDSISEIQMSVRELNDGNLPSNLQFFSGGEKNEEKLFEIVAKNVGIIKRSNQTFLEFLT